MLSTLLGAARKSPGAYSSLRRGLVNSAYSTKTKGLATRFATGAAIALAIPTYLYVNKLYLDSRPVVVDSESAQAVNLNAEKAGKKVSVKEVLERRDGDAVWVVIRGEVYDMTEFVDEHPGGKDIIINNRSKDVTPIFNPRHPADQLDAANIPPSLRHVGRLDVETASRSDKEELRLKVAKGEQEEESRIAQLRAEVEEKGLGDVLNMRDFEKRAETMLSSTGWGYYHSGADDEITKLANSSVYEKITFRPRILRRVAKADASTTILGQKSVIPLMISPAAMAKLGHPLGEVNMTRGAGNMGVIQCISSYASCSVEEICAARAPDQPLFFQLYFNRDRTIGDQILKKVNKLGFKAILLTGDTPILGKRERDLRVAGNYEPPTAAYEEKHAHKRPTDPDLHWDDIQWIRERTDLPIIIKGVQCVEDAVLAYNAGADGVVLSNHGGRQLDTTKTGIETLLEIRKHAPQLLRPQFRVPTGVTPAALEHPENLTPPDPTDEKPLDRPFEIWVDGGVWRGRDVVKALCLGANAVGAGRGFLYANTVGGQKGVEHAVGIFESEILLTMRLLGANKVDDLRPSMVDVKEV
ncbi:hypothetical protein IAT38_000274 [Cryptococcus sp. DSM 104549]